ncbi:MAG: cyclodeaminase/cyclohydrolase family protein [Planctomycetia bacterium]|jgi:formiminotetrahydrofolate cyclodeaminase
MQPALFDLTLDQFTQRLAERSATPGGGSAAAAWIADAAALLAMVARFSTGEAYAAVAPSMEQRADLAERARRRCLELVELDARSYDALSCAFKLPKDDEARKAERAAAIQAASKGALETPLETMERGCEVLECMAATVPGSNKNLATDLASGALAARAGLEAAWLNVRVNAGSIKDKPWVEERLARGETLRARAQVALGVVLQHADGVLAG